MSWDKYYEMKLKALLRDTAKWGNAFDESVARKAAAFADVCIKERAKRFKGNRGALPTSSRSR